jgi:hypothetical protein
MADKPVKRTAFECDERERHLLELIRKTEYGEIKIIVQDGCPIRVEEVTRSIKL